MSLVLVRIDDRLIHGQVTVGWGSFLNPDRIMLVSDDIAQNNWEKELYESCVPFNMKVSPFLLFGKSCWIVMESLFFVPLVRISSLDPSL